MSYYSLTLYRAKPDGKEEVIKNGVASTNPMHALTRMGRMFEADGGFGTISRIECTDQETGIVQWELLIK